MVNTEFKECSNEQMTSMGELTCLYYRYVNVASVKAHSKISNVTAAFLHIVS